MLTFRASGSKSEMIRALILQSYFPQMKIQGQSECEDVIAVRSALLSSTSTRPDLRTLDLKDSGFGFRAMAMRVSRKPGIWKLTGSARLLSRPHADLVHVLSQLGCDVQMHADGIQIQSPVDGEWQTDHVLEVPGSSSSQFLSGVLLNAFGLKNKLEVRWTKPFRSRGYVDLTMRFLISVGLKVRWTEEHDHCAIQILPGQKMKGDQTLFVEGDWSTAFAAAAIGLFKNGVRLEGLNADSAQPDRIGIEWMNQMGAKIVWSENGDCVVESLSALGVSLQGITVDASGSPDLVPVLSVLTALAEGHGRVLNAPHLRFKESDRIAKAVQMARFLGAKAFARDDGFEIFGRQDWQSKIISEPTMGIWSCDQDHRQTMAGLVALAAGFRFEIDGFFNISKSAPELLTFAGEAGVKPISPKRIFIGHRGVGKTTLLRALKTPEAQSSVDIDEALEKKTQLSTSSFFNHLGEAQFRVAERAVLKEQIDLGVNLISVGAGFQWDADSRKDARAFRKVWVRRASDETARIFTDRPRLDPKVSAVEEFETRRQERNLLFQSECDQSLILPEGIEDRRAGQITLEENRLLFGNPDFKNASITIPRSVLKSVDTFEHYLVLRQNWRVRFWELREDFLPDVRDATKIAEMLIDRVGIEHVLWSSRLDPESSLRFDKINSLFQNSKAFCDWALELGPLNAPAQNQIISCHTSFPNFPTGDFYLKWAPILPAENAWTFLIQGHEWWMQDVKKRVFLPRTSLDEKFPRFEWYRLWSSVRFDPLLNFIREDQGSALDQAALLNWLYEQESPHDYSWGAVLGDPSYLSRSPQTHGPSFFPISIRPLEWDQAFLWLTQMGLNRAAVTAPLKQIAFEWLIKTAGSEFSEAAKKLGSVNTLAKVGSTWKGENTDVTGFAKLIQTLQLTAPGVVLWGGGGTIAMVMEVFPSAIPYSARTGKSRVQDLAAHAHPQILIWAVGRTQFHDIFPPPEWNPAIVLDLNYGEDSPGREYALRANVKNYISGLDFFRYQAEYQKRFWKLNQGLTEER